MEAEKASICSSFQVTLTQSPSSPYRRSHPHCSLTCPGCRQVCGFLCSSECHQSSPKARAHRGASIGYPQRHQVGTTSGLTRWGQPSDQNNWKGRQERSETGWCYFRQGSRNSWAKVSTSPDQDSGGGEATMGSEQYGVKVVHRPPLPRPEDAKDGHPPAGPRSSKDGAHAESCQGHGIRDQVGCPLVHLGSWRMDAPRHGGDKVTGQQGAEALR
jgi:hypothetical protein